MRRTPSIGTGRRVCASLALMVALAGPASAQRPEGSAVRPAPLPAAETHGPAVADYEIGPQDILKVTVYGHEDLTQIILVQADGTFTFPLIGRVKADGMTTKQLGQSITMLLGRGFVRNPQVTVVVQEYRSKTVFVVGELAHPGTYPLSGRLTLVEILARAGPATANAGAEVIVVRPPVGTRVQGPVLPTHVATGPEGPQSEVIRIVMRDLQTGAPEKNIELAANDTVFVPQAPKVFVSGEVRNPGAYAWFPGMTARQLISVAGGLTPEGSDGRLKVVRERDGKSHEDSIKRDEHVTAGETLVVRRRLF